MRQHEEIVVVGSEDLTFGIQWCQKGRILFVGLDEQFSHSEPFVKMIRNFAGRHVVFVFRANWDSHLLRGFRKVFPEHRRFKKLEFSVIAYTQVFHLFCMPNTAFS